MDNEAIWKLMQEMEQKDARQEIIENNDVQQQAGITSQQ